jgi:hypothetical protein
LSQMQTNKKNEPFWIQQWWFNGPKNLLFMGCGPNDTGYTESIIIHINSSIILITKFCQKNLYSCKSISLYIIN